MSETKELTEEVTMTASEAQMYAGSLYRIMAHLDGSTPMSKAALTTHYATLKYLAERLETVKEPA